VALLLKQAGSERVCSVDLFDGCEKGLLHLEGVQEISWETFASLKALQTIFCSRQVGYLTWSGLRRLAGGIFAKSFSIGTVETMLGLHENLLVDLGSEPFHPVACGGDAARATAVFELFIDAVARFDRGLVCFSRQRLFPESGPNPSTEAVRSSWRPDYRKEAMGRPSYRDANNRLRFESVQQNRRSVASLEEALHPSAFDKLVAALARGQLLLES
jgi:hypothetical protein